jgi:alanine dehydrogenase
MIIGVPKEIKPQENRVALTPAGVDGLVRNGHKVLIESGAGLGSSFSDDEYKSNGAEIILDAAEVWEKADMILKVKEPLESEYTYFRQGLTIFTYLHLASDENLTRALMKSGAVAIAYETVQRPDGTLPLLAPMSEIAGRMAVQQGSIYLEKTRGGKGMLIDGVPGVAPAHVVVVGAGIVGTGAIRRAIGLGCRVSVLDINLDRLRYLNEVFMGRIETLYSNNYNIKEACKTADLVIGAVLVPGAKAPKLITEDIVKSMQPGSVIVDVAIDQGGCVETIDKPTTHADPVFVKHDIIHYAVANIPGAVPKTSTLALTNVTLGYAIKLANLGWKQAFINDPSFAKGANVIDGKIVYKPVADAFGMEYTPLEEVMNNF